MKSISRAGSGWLQGLLIAAMAGVPLTADPPAALAASPVRVVECNPTSLSDAVKTNGVDVVGAIDDGDTETEEQEDQVEEDQLPKIVGSIAKPRGVSEDDSKKLENLGLATITREQALERAKAAVVDPAQRTFRSPKLEGENGYLVWAVETRLINRGSGPDRELEVKVDAGGDGNVLSVECD